MGEDEICSFVHTVHIQATTAVHLDEEAGSTDLGQVACCWFCCWADVMLAHPMIDDMYSLLHYRYSMLTYFVSKKNGPNDKLTKSESFVPP